MLFIVTEIDMTQALTVHTRCHKNCKVTQTFGFFFSMEVLRYYTNRLGSERSVNCSENDL